ncbi:MAG: GNAT family N-acetyltransferase [Bacteroidia bacterium]|nr:GNAT family N-acetyltransferase [Bacteroidia bacterium]
MQITTQRCILWNADEQLLNLAISNETAFTELLNVKPARNWNQFGTEIFSYVLEKIKTNPQEQIWWAWFPIHSDSKSLIGTCGFKGPPNAHGELEIGYEIAPDFRNRGLATEIAAALVEFAREQKQVNRVIAHTLADDPISAAVLKKVGFRFSSELDDPEDGRVKRWEFDF